ncbi:hypothetical protein EDC01DRAFT_621083 [Geopyxis carbonaria]|nr:hypothetical protein EDC01DRAFT_621083 [Geopyxis carbonaria]
MCDPPPSLLTAALSNTLIVATGLWSKATLYASQRSVTVLGLPAFLSLLDARRSGADPRGLLTVSNHKSVVDDPLIWGVLPPRYLFPASQVRHSLGSADICFASPLAGAFFALGNVHPTWRTHQTPGRGGLWQPSIDALPAWMDAGRWVHVFPEGRVHQHPRGDMRYFKWGIARALLESERAPVVVPMFVSGFEGIMPEDRGFPRWWPRWGNDVRVVFGEAIDGEDGWGDLRRRWRTFVESGGDVREGKEAVELRIEATRRVREAVGEVRRGLGLPEEAKGAGDPETYREPGMDKKQGQLDDGTMVKDT